MKPHLTAVIICHKLEQYVDMAIGSVVTQNRKCDRVVLLGTDARWETRAALDKWLGIGNICYTPQPMTCTQSKNRAAAIVAENARQLEIPIEDAYFFTLDADDWIEPAFTEKLMLTIGYTKADACGCDYEVLQTNGIRTPAHSNGRGVESIRTENPMPSCSIINLAAFQSVGGYTNEGSQFEDWEFWVKMVAASRKTLRYPLSLYTYRRHAHNITNHYDSPVEIAKAKAFANARLIAQVQPAQAGEDAGRDMGGPARSDLRLP